MTAITIAIAPIANAAIRPTSTSSCSESLPLRTTFDHTSCATAPDAEITRPATTARMVANAIAEMIARKASPPTEPGAAANLLRQERSREVAGLVDLPVVPASPRMARAPKPRNVVMT